MGKKVIVLMAHGMGAITLDAHQKRIQAFKKKIRKQIGKALNNQVHYASIYYQGVFQRQQNKVFAVMKPHIDGKGLRRFMLYGFSDAAGYESRAHEENSEYEQVQQKIRHAIDAACEAVGRDDLPVVLIAHSLGGQVISNYIWDAQQETQHVGSGIWQKADVGGTREHAHRFKNLRALYTTGCNIPIFIAGKQNIKAIRPDADGYDFEWHNYYDEDDVLGWPLQPLGNFYEAGRCVEASYADAVHDHPMNANGNVLGLLYRGWNPLSHGGYWQDSDFTKPVAAMIRSLL